MRKSLEQSMAVALATFLQTQFDAALLTNAELGAVRVDDQWPAHDEALPVESGGVPWSAISIITAGKRDDFRLQEELSKVETTADPNTLLCTYACAVSRQEYQLDVWAQSAPRLTMLKAYLEDFLRMGTFYTLSDGYGELVRDGVLLPLPTGADYPFEGKVDFTFDGPVDTHDGEAHRAWEYRSMIRCHADGVLTTKAASPRLARVILKMQLGGSPATATFVPGDDGFDVSSIQL